MATTEIVDIVDENNDVIGSASVAEAHEKKLLHRVVGVFIFDADGSLYLQTGNKYGKLDLPVGGHVQQGEEYEIAAKREMLEEIGLDVPILHVTTFLPKDARLGHYWGLFSAVAPEGWQFIATEEVSSLSKFNIHEVIKKMKLEPDLFTHGFMNAMAEFVQIDNV